jgi:hypothetical protein
MIEDLTRRSALKSVAAGAALAGVGTATLAAGTAQAQQRGDQEGDVVSAAQALRDASWRLSYRWIGDGEGSTTITFRSDGTFIAGGNLRGRWFQIGYEFIFAFENTSPPWSVVYAGTISQNGGSFSGIQGKTSTSGNPKGTHSAVRANMLVENQADLRSEGTSATGEEQK